MLLKHFNISRRLLVAAAVPVLALSSVALHAQPLSAQQKQGFQDFTKRVQAYLSMVRNLPADKLKPSKDIAALQKQRIQLREAIVAARSGAKQGDVFTPEASDAFRKVLAHTLAGPNGHKIRASLAHAEPIAHPDLTVNGVYPNTEGQPIQSVPPSLLLHLPVLPKGVEYCLSGKSLALRDTEANLVIDYLPDALP